MHSVLVLQDAYSLDSFRTRKWVICQGRWLLISWSSANKPATVAICRSNDGQWHADAVIWARLGAEHGLKDAVRWLYYADPSQLDAGKADVEDGLILQPVWS